ncbi:MAG: DNA/RNA nuclease SfsA [Bacillota bacterium]|jgi:sugar fermentation stimulation protein A|uniref:Sugar fermentation stimulation protein homolog n=1 Tax=Thermanaerosceptrum fracticalcis TaxID=1712410 RepID=A0A7G6DZI1_THEFR|nr:DNA/RNA nuclease SfsA [Thermanaerosceptrum fracticalcis]MBZ4653363.1 hypothetical protein [Peptococcaceae bacterium]QNB45235.1 DNA/RNA nuclease SfsA [Thermanaerosceptrum fracticalcis]
MDIQFPPFIKGILKERLNRFTALVEVDGKEALAHVPNSGRLKELLLPGTPVRLQKDETNPHRKTAYDLLLVEKEGKLISIDSRLPNDLVVAALGKNKIKPLWDVTLIKREAAWGLSRFDFYLEDSRGSIWLETKSVNLVEDHIAKFPDAVTKRGTRHLVELKALKRQGLRAVVLFLVLRNDATSFAPHRERDPDFSRALEECIREGVEVYAFLCDVQEKGISLGQEIPVTGK